MLAISPIADTIKRELGSVFSTENHKDPDIIRYINSAIRDLTIERNFTFNKFKTTQIVVQWATDYTIPYQIETFFVFDSNNTPSRILNFENYYNYILQQNNIHDTTNVVWVWDDKFVCSTPWTYTIIYRWAVEPIIELDSTVDIPSMFQDAIICWALKYGYMDEKDFATANHKQSVFNWLVKSLASRNTNTTPNQDIQMWVLNRI